MSYLFPSQTRKLLRKNPNPKSVAAQTGVNLSTVYRHAKGMDLKLIAELNKKGWDSKAMIRFLANEGILTNAAIARKLGVTLPYVTEVLND